MAILIINGIDMSGKITNYALTDEEPVKLSEIQMADGTSLVRLAPYTKTEISVTFSNLTGPEFASFINAFTNNQAVVDYYSEKSNAMKNGTFFREPLSYEVKKKTRNRDVLSDVTMLLRKMG